VVRRHKTDESGATLVEFALILPVLALLVFGVIEFGYNFNNYIAVRQGVREGARQGVVANFGTTTSCSLTTGSAASANTPTKELLCTTKDRIGISSPAPTELRTKVVFDPTTCSGGAGFCGTYTSGNGLIVCAIYPAKSFTGLISPFLANTMLKSKVEMRIEQTPSSSSPQLQAVQEDPPSGANWNFCS